MGLNVHFDIPDCVGSTVLTPSRCGTIRSMDILYGARQARDVSEMAQFTSNMKRRNDPGFNRE